MIPTQDTNIIAEGQGLVTSHFATAPVIQGIIPVANLRARLDQWPLPADLRGKRPHRIAVFPAECGIGMHQLFFRGAAFLMTGFLAAIFLAILNLLMPYFLRSALCGLRLPIRPLSLPAAGSRTAFMSVGLPESIASFTARLSSSGVVALTPTPPKASIILS